MGLFHLAVLEHRVRSDLLVVVRSRVGALPDNRDLLPDNPVGNMEDSLAVERPGNQSVVGSLAAGIRTVGRRDMEGTVGSGSHLLKYKLNIN